MCSRSHRSKSASVGEQRYGFAVRLALATLPLLLAGCDILFQLRDVKNDPDAPMPIEASVDAAPRCQLSDTFEDGFLSAQWTVINPAQDTGIVSEKMGLLDIALRNDIDDAYNGLITTAKHDLAGKLVRATVFPMYSGGWYENYFTIRSDQQNEAFFQSGAGNISATVATGGQRASAFFSYNPELHRHWQFRHDPVARLLYFEVSGDGLVFEPLHTLPVQWSLAQVDILFVAGTYLPGGPPPGSARFDDLSVCPP